MDTLNALIESIASPVLEVSRVVRAISEGDLTQQQVEIDAHGRRHRAPWPSALNIAVDNLNELLGEINESSQIVGDVVGGDGSERARR